MHIRKSVLLLASALSSGLAAPLWAQGATASDSASTIDNSEASPSDVGEIIVTAQKREQSLNKVGAPITALSQDTLADRGVVSLADLAQVVPGLSFSTSQYGTPVYTLRGVGFTDASLSAYPSVTVYLDQVPLPFPILSTLTNFDLQRVEVLQGPQGTLFGSNATGGAINYIAAKPTAQMSGGVALTYGRFNQTLIDAHVSGPLSDTLKYRVAARIHNADDWQYSYTHGGKVGEVSTLAGRVLLDWDPSERLSFELNLNGWKDRSDPQQPQAFELQVQAPPTPAIEQSFPLAPFNPRATDFNENLPLYNDSWLYQGSLRGALELTDDLTITSLTSFIRAKRDAAMQVDGTPFSQSDYSQFGTSRNFFQELRIDNGARLPTRWTVGLNYSKDDVRELDGVLFSEGSAQNTGLGLGIFGRYTQFTDNYAVFGNIEHDIMSSVTLKAGIRYTKTERNGTSCSFDGTDGNASALFQFLQSLTAPTGTTQPIIGLNDCFSINPATGLAGQFSGKLDEDNVSYRLGIDWKPSDALLLYFNYSKGYKAGGFPAVLASTFAQYSPVTQESLIDFEGGFKAQLFDRNIFLTGTAFYYDYTDKQLRSKVFDQLGIFGAIDAVVNVPKSSVKGAEMSLSTRPIAGFLPTLSATYLDTSVDEFVGVNAGGQQADFSGTRIPFAPKWSINADLQHSFRVSSSVSAYLGGSLTYRSKTNSLVGGTSEFDIPAYTLLDLRAGVEGGNWKLFAFGKNVTNKYYVRDVLRQYDYVVRFTGAPSTYGVTLSYTY